MDDLILFGGTQAPQREDLSDKNLMDDRLFAICMQNENMVQATISTVFIAGVMTIRVQ